jgi:hypothetical protein
LAQAGSITAQTGMWLQGGSEVVDLFGTLTGSTDAINTKFGGALTLTLESTSVLSGNISANSTDDTFTILAGANISGATFDGGGGNDSLILSGDTGTGTFDVSKVQNVETFQKSGNSVWALTGSSAGTTPWTISEGRSAFRTMHL